MMNIASNNVVGKCDNKCLYNFDYPKTNIVATNLGKSIMLKVDDSTKPPVSYNNESYIVSAIYIFAPSVHNFNNVKTAGEIIIEHTSDTSSLKLMVCIPIIESSFRTKASVSLAKIINQVASKAPSDGEKTNFNESNFTLDDIVPNSKFFAYTGKDMHGTPANVIVFGSLDGIPVKQSIVSIMGSIIQPNNMSIGNYDLFFNSNGPGKNAEGIYIDCKPTGASADDSSDDSSGSDSGSFFNSPGFKTAVKTVLFTLFFVFIFYVLNYLYTMFTDDKLRLPVIPTFAEMRQNASNLIRRDNKKE